MEWGHAELHILTRAIENRTRWRQIGNQAVDTYRCMFKLDCCGGESGEIKVGLTCWINQRDYDSIQIMIMILFRATIDWCQVHYLNGAIESH